MVLKRVYLWYIIPASAALSVFFVASVQDLRDREVSDILWIVLGSLGFALFAAGIAFGNYDVPGLSSIALLLPAFLFADMFVDWQKLLGKSGNPARYSIAAVLLFIAVLQSIQHIGSIYVDAMLSTSAWIAFIFLLYRIDVIKGGADAKALVTLAIIFPFYPQTLSGAKMPVYSDLTFPFFLSVLMMGAIFSSVVPLILAGRNAAKGNLRLPHMFLGLVRNVEAVDLSKEWLLEVSDENGQPKRVRKLGTVDENVALAEIRRAGWKSVWISPKLPFIVPLAAGLIFVLAVGNPLFYL